VTETSFRPVAGQDYPRNFQEFLDWFADEDRCYAFLERLRWREGFICPHCGARESYWQASRGRRRCTACRKDTSVTAGTVLDKTRLPLRTWFFAMWYVVNQKTGVSALGLQRVLGLGSYETAWTWLHKLRRAMVRPGREMIGGPGAIVEIDETIIGGVRSGQSGRHVGHKVIVVIAVETTEKAAGRVRMAPIPNMTKDTLTGFILDNVQRGSTVRTDGWIGYFDVGRYRYRHEVTNISASGDPANVVFPDVHRVASLLKRWLLGTHQGAISKQQLDYYLDEFTFRFNRRNSKHRGMLFYRLIEGAVAIEPHPYERVKAA
jgi:transposase-like protein